VKPQVVRRLALEYQEGLCSVQYRLGVSRSLDVASGRRRQIELTTLPSGRIHASTGFCLFGTRSVSSPVFANLDPRGTDPIFKYAAIRIVKY
jgi:hypothetical protein